MSELKKISDEIKALIAKRQKDTGLSFTEDTHTYYINDLNGESTTRFPSVSTVLKGFYPVFDSASTRSFKNCGGKIELEKQLLTEWAAKGDYATNMGSRVHFILEKELIAQYGSYKEVREPIFTCDEEQTKTGDQMIKAGLSFIELMHQRGAVLLDTEMVLGDAEYGYTGQPDKVWLMMGKDGKPGIVITDWKGLPLDTPILTDSGWKNMGTLTKKDKVFDKDGNLVDIKNISEVKNKKCLKIKFDNAEEIISDFEHRWLVYTERYGKKKEVVMTTQEIKDYNDGLERRYSHKILKIENAKPLFANDKELPIDPYVLGVWLGDGHSIDSKITQANTEVWDEIKKRGYKIGEDVSGGSSGKATTRTIFDMRHKLRELNLIQNKHLPEVYLLSSFEQRLDVLRGLMDSDGHFNKLRNRYSVSTTRKSQVQFCIELFSSLGLKPTVISYVKKINGKKIKCWNTEFTTDDFNPFLCRNQDINFKIKKNKSSYRNINSVEEVESVPTKCIEVDSPTSTFLCGKSLIVTHNTNQKKNFKVQPWTKKLFAPFSKYDDTALGHYYIQLPLYAKLLLKMLKGTKYEDINFLGAVVVLVTDKGEFEEFKVPKDVVTKVMDMNVQDTLKDREVHIKRHKFLESRDQGIRES